MTRRAYSEQERAEAVGLASTIGVYPAAHQLGLPRRTLTNWMHSPSPAVQAVIVSSREALAAKLWEAVSVGTEEVLRGLRDPKARLSDKARALEVVAAQHALLTGAATSRTESYNVNATAAVELDDDEARQLRDWIDAVEAATDDELNADATRARDAKRLGYAAIHGRYPAESVAEEEEQA